MKYLAEQCRKEIIYLPTAFLSLTDKLAKEVKNNRAFREKLLLGWKVNLKKKKKEVVGHLSKEFQGSYLGEAINSLEQMKTNPELILQVIMKAQASRNCHFSSIQLPE